MCKVEVKEFALSTRAKAAVGGPSMRTYTRDMTLDAARVQAEEDFPEKRVVRVDVTEVTGPYQIFDQITGDLTDEVDWVGRADVYLEQAGNLGG